MGRRIMVKKLAIPMDKSEADTRRDRRPERRRKALRDALEAARLTPTEAARAAGLTSANMIFNFLQGRSKGLSQTTLERLAAVIPGSSLASLTGLEDTDAISPPVRPLQVRAAAAASLMQSAFDLPARLQRQVYMPVTEDQQTAGVFGVVVREPGTEKLFPVDTILVCMPLHAYEDPVVNCEKVILQRIAGGKVEVTVRELEIHANEAWLWLRSTHPEHQAPVRMPYSIGRPPEPWRDRDTRFSVAAIVVGAYVPLKPAKP